MAGPASGWEAEEGALEFAFVGHKRYNRRVCDAGWLMARAAFHFLVGAHQWVASIIMVESFDVEAHGYEIYAEVLLVTGSTILTCYFFARVEPCAGINAHLNGLVAIQAERVGTTPFSEGVALGTIGHAFQVCMEGGEFSGRY